MNMIQIVFCTLLYFQSVLGIGRFTNPAIEDGQVTYNQGEQVTITWTDTDDYNILSLGVSQSNNETVSWLIENSGFHPTSYEWVVDVDSLGFDLDSSRLFSFVLVNVTDFGQLSESAEFSVQGSPSDTLVTVTVTATSPATATATSSASPPLTIGQDRPNVGARIGFWVGLLVGILLLLGVAAFFYRRHYGTRAQQNFPNPAQINSMAVDPQASAGTQQPVEYYAVKPPQPQAQTNIPLEFYAVSPTKPESSRQAPPPGTVT